MHPEGWLIVAATMAEGEGRPRVHNFEAQRREASVGESSRELELRDERKHGTSYSLVCA